MKLDTTSVATEMVTVSTVSPTVLCFILGCFVNSSASNIYGHICTYPLVSRSNMKVEYVSHFSFFRLFNVFCFFFFFFFFFIIEFFLFSHVCKTKNGSRGLKIKRLYETMHEERGSVVFTPIGTITRQSCLYILYFLFVLLK